MSADDHIERDDRIIATVDCPYCGAPKGAPCTLDGRPRSMPHAERLARWRAAQGVGSEPRPLDNRDRKVVDSVPCIYCGAAIGERCVRHPGSTVVIHGVHGERREARQRLRGPTTALDSPVCVCGHKAREHSGGGGCKRCTCTRSREQVRDA